MPSPTGGSVEPFTEGPGYRLCSLTVDDIQALAAFSEDERYWRFLSHGPRTIEQVQAFVESAVAASAHPDGAEQWWAIDDPDTSALIGTANIKRVGKTEDRQGSVGCTLDPDAQGRGLGPILGWVMITLAFDRFGLEQVECTCAEDNERSVHTMRDTFGMTYEGVRESDTPRGPWRMHVFTLTAADFRKKTPR